MNDEWGRRNAEGVYAVVKEAVRGRGPRRQVLLYIPAALRARRVWRAAPGAGKRVWRWTCTLKKSGKFFRPTAVARSARERGGLLVVMGQGVMACEAGKKDCRAEIPVADYWWFNVIRAHGQRIASRVCADGCAAGRPDTGLLTEITVARSSPFVCPLLLKPRPRRMRRDEPVGPTQIAGFCKRAG